MEVLMQSLQMILDENDHVLSIPDNQEEFFHYNNHNNQSFANNVDYDFYNMNNEKVK